MRAVVQRVQMANVEINGEIVSSVGKGLLVFLGVENEDDDNDVSYLAEKIVNLRIFEDLQEKMNLSLMDVQGELLVVSQFTLLGDCRKGRRPSFVRSKEPCAANILYEKFITVCKQMNIKTLSGEFQADMKVKLINDGPVTILLDSKKVF